MDAKAAKKLPATIWSSLSDGQIMLLICSGEMEPLAELYLRYGGMVKDALARFCPELSQAEAEDLSQDVFLVVSQKSKHYREQSQFRAWLYSIAVKKAAAWRRTYWLRKNLLDRHRGQRVGTAVRRSDDPARDCEVRDSLSHALEELKKPLRDVLFLHAVEGFTGEEIAQILDIRPKTVWTRLHRARKEIMERLEAVNESPLLCKGEI